MKFSIIVPSYNQGQFLSKTLDSILSQSGDFDIECLVFDGGSTDTSVEVLTDFGKKIKNDFFKRSGFQTNFYWESKKDDGQSNAINKGLKKSTGDIVAWLNSDDSYVPGTFSLVKKSFIQNPNKKWLSGHCQIINENDTPTRGLIVKYKNYWLDHYSYNNLLVLNFISQPSTFWRKELIEKSGFLNEDLHYSMDYDYWLRFGKVSDPIIVKSILSNFRVHGRSKSETNFTKQFDQDLGCATRNSRNKFILAAHRLHNFFIKTIYGIIK